MSLSSHTISHLYKDIFFIDPIGRGKDEKKVERQSYPFIFLLHEAEEKNFPSEEKIYANEICRFFGIDAADISIRRAKETSIRADELALAEKGYFIFSDAKEWTINNKKLNFKSDFIYLKGKHLFVIKAPSFSSYAKGKDAPFFKQEMRRIADEAHVSLV